MIRDEDRCCAQTIRGRCHRRGEVRDERGRLLCVYCAAAHERERKREGRVRA